MTQEGARPASSPCIQLEIGTLAISGGSALDAVRLRDALEHQLWRALADPVRSSALTTHPGMTQHRRDGGSLRSMSSIDTLAEALATRILESLSPKGAP
jgi:hypothetical protein